MFVGKQALYIYSKVNYKTLVGKSTKIRLFYRDLLQISSANSEGILIKVKTTRFVGQDLRSPGTESYKVLNEYKLTKFGSPIQREDCFNLLAQQMERVNTTLTPSSVRAESNP